jgi:tyrosyl-tRNA synthetase
MTSPYSWYQYFLNAADADVIRYLRWFTFLGKDELDRLAVEVEERPFKREAQRVLAREMTELVHGADSVAKVEKAAEALFGKAELADLDAQTLTGALSETDCAEVAPGTGVVDMFVEAGLEKSKGAARRTIGEGGAYVNNVRVTDPEWVPGREDLLAGDWLVLRKGKKRFAGITLVDGA